MLWNRLIGFRSDGRPIYGFVGGAPDDDGDDDGDDGDDDPGDGDDDTKVGDDGLTGKGRKAIEAERAAAKRARDELRPYKVALRAAGIHSPDDLAKALTKNDSKGSEEQVDVEKIRREAQAAADAKAFRLVTESKIEARAVRKFADPEDAVNALRGDIDTFYDPDTGKIDVKAIDNELARVLERKPHYAAQKKTPDFDGGARKTATTSAGFDAQLRAESDRRRGRTR